MVTRTGFEPVNVPVKGVCVNHFTNGPSKLAPETGIEPVTCRLTAGRSTAELFRRCLIILPRIP